MSVKEAKKVYHFGGWATKFGIKCNDGRTILHNAFEDADGTKVPLVWQHGHGDITNVLGHAILENREEGVYAYGMLNDSDKAKAAKKMIEHGDLDSLSIYANDLVEKSGKVIHGKIRELSLVLSGANSGAKIENLSIAHGDESYPDEEEAIIHMGLELEPGGELSHADEEKEEPEDDDEITGEEVATIIESLTDEQKAAVGILVEAALEEGGASGKNIEHSDDDEDEEDLVIKHNSTGGTKVMKANVFEKRGEERKGPSLSHTDIKAIFEDAQKTGSLKESFLAHATVQDYGIENIDYLFPDAQKTQNDPSMIQRRMEWVEKVIGPARKLGFSRIKSVHADITAEEARARGYIKGNKKVEEIIKLLKRVTTPQTIYKKQKLDRDDIIDITDLDVVAWLKAEMRMMLEEEIARAVLFGDGRSAASQDKINEDNIRPILSDNELYSIKHVVPASTTVEDLPDIMIKSRKKYKGSGRPTLFTSEDILTDMMLLKDLNKRRIYGTEAELAAAIRMSEIVPVELMDELEWTGKISDDAQEATYDVLGIAVNMSDYCIGSTRGGETTFFDDFDIDYNQYKYLYETRMSGALDKPFTAVVILREKTSSAPQG